MRAFVALSFRDPGAEGEQRRRLVARAVRGVEKLTGGAPGAAAVSDPVTEVVVAGPGPSDLIGPEGFVLLGVRTCRTRGGEVVGGHRLLERLRADRDATLGSLAPPSSLCFRPDPGGAVVAATDTSGLGSLYWTEGEGWAGLSSSSLLLAWIAERDLDVEAIGHYALVGAYLGERTPYAGVRRLDRGVRAELRAGAVATGRHSAAPPGHLPRRSRAEAVEAGTEAVREAVGSCLLAHPDAVLELSGGLDSRMVLAAVPPERRRLLRAVTAGAAGEADLEIARRLASAGGLRHEAVDMAGLARLGPAEAIELASRASLRRDHTGNPLALAVTDWIDGRVEAAPRLSGQNGEFARGFYYAGQPPFPSAPRPLVDALARWRVFTNDAVSPSVFAPGFAEANEERTIRAVEEAFSRFPGDWLGATDEFYLAVRMQRWVGAAYAGACTDRSILAPFFDPVFVDWARRARPSDKRGSRLFAEVLARLDPALAEVALPSGMSVRQLFDRAPRARATRYATTARKVGAKVLQKVTARGRPPAGAPGLAGMVAASWSEAGHGLPRVAALPFLDGGAVAGIAAGTAAATPATVALLLALDGMLAFLHRP